MEQNVSTENISLNKNKPENDILRLVERYKNHPSILAISHISQMRGNNIFSFKDVSYEDIKNGLLQLDAIDIPTKIIKENVDIIGDFVYQNFNNAIATSIFPFNLKKC